MKLVKKDQTGGTSHYTLEPEGPSDMGGPTQSFRAFVRGLHWGPVSTAVSLGQFQSRVEKLFD